jgi:peptidoglycan/LPS O-acetylase OafA/YrhL
VDRHPHSRHIPVLDGLRGIAIIAVIVCHVNWTYGGPFMGGRLNGPLAMVFGWGWVGVDLFFVLSGFLITGILYDARGCGGYFRNFYARRTLRIMPLYFGFLFIVLVVLPRLPGVLVPAKEISNADGRSLWLYYYNFRVALTENAVPYHHHFWSLAIEEHFYLLWPLAVWFLNRRPLMGFCLVVASFSLILRIIVVLGGPWPASAFFLTPCRLDGLLAGSFIALAWRDPAAWAWLQRHAGRLVVASGCLVLGIALGQRHFIPDVRPGQVGLEAAVNGNLVLTIGVAALAVFFAGLVGLAVNAPPNSRMRQVLENRTLRAIGKYSYAMYVFHALILVACAGFLARWLDVPVFVAKPAAVVWVTAVSFGAAWLSYHLY